MSDQEKAAAEAAAKDKAAADAAAKKVAAEEKAAAEEQAKKDAAEKARLAEEDKTLIRMKKGETISKVHPSCVASHREAGWSVVES